MSVPSFSPTTLSELETYFDDLAFELTNSISVSLDERAKLHVVEKLCNERRAKRAALVHVGRCFIDTKIYPTDKFTLSCTTLIEHFKVLNEIDRSFSYGASQTVVPSKSDQEIQCYIPAAKTKEYIELEGQLAASLNENAAMVKKYADLHNEFANYRKRSMRESAEAAQTHSDTTEKLAQLQARLVQHDLEKQTLVNLNTSLRAELDGVIAQRHAALAKLDALRKQKAPDAAELEVAILRSSLKTAKEEETIKRQVVAKFQQNYEEQNEALRKALMNVRNKLNM